MNINGIKIMQILFGSIERENLDSKYFIHSAISLPTTYFHSIKY